MDKVGIEDGWVSWSSVGMEWPKTYTWVSMFCPTRARLALLLQLYNGFGQKCFVFISLDGLLSKSKTLQQSVTHAFLISRANNCSVLYGLNLATIDGLFDTSILLDPPHGGHFIEEVSWD